MTELERAQAEIKDLQSKVDKIKKAHLSTELEFSRWRNAHEHLRMAIISPKKGKDWNAVDLLLETNKRILKGDL